MVASVAGAQISEREFPYKTGATVEIKNLFGRVWVVADESVKEKALVRK